MEIIVTDNDINNWIRLAQTNETMRAKLLECATVYALANPEHATVTPKNRFKSAEEEARSIQRLMKERYGL